MAGLAALVEQYVKSRHPQQDAAASADLTNHLLVSTAVPQQENGVYVSPRRQGAGLVNAAAAISTPAYIDVDGKLVGKLEPVSYTHLIQGGFREPQPPRNIIHRCPKVAVLRKQFQRCFPNSFFRISSHNIPPCR